MTLLFFYLALALAVSFLCSMLEAVLLSIQPTYVAALTTAKPRVGDLLARLKADIDRPLAAILILNTISHTVGAAGVGAQAVKIFGSSSVGWVSAVLTLLILVLSEIIPKTLGASYWRRLAPLSGRILYVMILCLYPLVVVSRALSSLLAREKDQPTVSRAELTALADVVASEGVVDEVESRVLRNLLRLRTLRARDIMTPRNVLVAFDAQTTVGEAIEDERQRQFSRLPIYRDTVDNIVGYVLKHDIMLEAAHDHDDVILGDLSRELVSMPETARLPEVLEAMLERKEHIVLLHEELGGTAGITTLEDVVETLLGLEIVDETDVTVDMRELARQSWKRRARERGLLVEPENGSKPGR